MGFHAAHQLTAEPLEVHHGEPAQVVIRHKALPQIKAFYGTSGNAVKTQVWIAVSVYMLVAIIKKRLHVHASLYAILQVLSIAAFEKIPIFEALSEHESKSSCIFVLPS